MNDILSRIKKIIAQRLEIDESLIKRDSYMIEDLGADSIDLVQIIIAFEVEFGIDVPSKDEEKFDRIDNILEYIESRIKNKV